MFDVAKLKSDFEIFKNNPQMVYLDSASTTHKPKSVINSQINYYTQSNSNVHRGNYPLAVAATLEYENSRKYVSKFLNSKHIQEIVFTKGTTDSINLVAQSLINPLDPLGVGEGFRSDFVNCLQPGDEILISQMEHHANLVPWQIIAMRYDLKIKYIPILANLELDLLEYEKLLNPRVKLVVVCHVSNTLGVINPILEITRLAHQNGSLVLIDGAQAVSHLKVNVQELNVDFYCFSGHKIFSPTGIGVLYAKKELLEMLPAYQGGGDMIDFVTYKTTKYNQLPYKFEAGTPNIAGAIGLAEGLKYFDTNSNQDIFVYEQKLLSYLQQGLSQICDIELISNQEHKVPIQSFVVKNIHPQDLDFYLAQKYICIRSGFHCTQPLLQKLGYDHGVCRVSLALYNTLEDIDMLLYWLKKAIKILKTD